MAERWQQWMPFHIDRFRGSPDVQAMHPAARMGFLYLLASAWQTEDCCLSPDPVDLATASGLGDEMWATYGPRILRKFETVDGRLRNEVEFAEWKDSHDRFIENREKKIQAGKMGAAKRWDGKRMAEGSTSHEKAWQKMATGTGTTTETKEQKQKQPQAAVVLPEWVNADTWEGYLDVRRKKRAVLTHRALGAVLRQLEQFRARGHDPNAILETSMRANWTDVYEPKPMFGTGPPVKTKFADPEAMNAV